VLREISWGGTLAPGALIRGEWGLAECEETRSRNKTRGLTDSGGAPGSCDGYGI
jgi:hypothetical protein